MAGSTITVKGSDTLVRLGQRWAEEYMKHHPETVIQVSGGGTGTAALLNGATDVCQASRDLKEKEHRQAERAPVIAANRHRAAMPFDLSTMLDLTVEMVKMSVDSLVISNTVEVRRVCEMDDQIDDRHREAVGLVPKQLSKAGDSADYLISLISVSRNLERIADHATKIAEDVIYMIEGEIVRHTDIS